MRPTILEFKNIMQCLYIGALNYDEPRNQRKMNK